MNISFLVTASETSHCLFEVIDSIEQAINDYHIKYTYEILVVSFEEIKYKNVIWVEDKLKQPGHVVQAVNSLIPHSTGEYIIGLSDDHKLPNSKPLRVVEWLQSDAFKDRKYKVSGIGASPGTLSALNRMTATAIPNISLWYTNPERFPDHAAFPEELKNPRFCSLEHRYLIVGYPVFERQTLMEHFGGYYFNPSFHHHWADNWLPFFVGETDGYTLVCEDTALQWCPRPGPTSVVKYDLEDYIAWCKLCVKLLNEGCTYYEKV